VYPAPHLLAPPLPAARRPGRLRPAAGPPVPLLWAGDFPLGCPWADYRPAAGPWAPRCRGAGGRGGGGRSRA